MIAQWLKGISSRMLLEEFAHLRRQFWGRHLWARGYFAVTSGTITDAMVKQYIADQEGEPLQDDSRFRIDDHFEISNGKINESIAMSSKPPVITV
jgi:putative transposase